MSLRIPQCLTLFLLVATSGCYTARSPRGGGMTETEGPRVVNAADVEVPDGYLIQPIAQGLTFPVGLTFDGQGHPVVVESGYSYGEVWTTPRLIRVGRDGSTSVIASGTDNGPWNGVTFHNGSFYLAEGGARRGGRILKVTSNGKVQSLLDGLPSMGDHHTNAVVVHEDWIYFGQGTATNSAVVGEDNASFGWLARHPEFHDIPCREVTLTGKNFESADIRTEDSDDKVETGAYSPFGTATQAGQVIEGKVPCTGAIMRIKLGGGPPELVAWGLRNPFAMAFAPDGQLYALDNSYDDRGSRPVHGTGDLLWAIMTGGWYGWPDYHGPRRLDHGDHFKPPGREEATPVIANPPGTPPEPVAYLGVHASADGIDFSTSDAFGYQGQAFIAEFGDQVPGTGKVLSPVGFKVVRVDIKDGTIEEFAVNRGSENGPASRLKTRGLERPVGVKFSPDGSALYIVDFGVLTMDDEGAHPQQGTGVLWRVTRNTAARAGGQ